MKTTLSMPSTISSTVKRDQRGPGIGIKQQFDHVCITLVGQSDGDEI